jgi:hypothetical protein
VALVRKGDEGVERLVNLVEYTVGCIPRFRRGRSRPPGGGQIQSRTAGAAVFTFAAEAGEGFFAVNRLHATALKVVVAAVQHFATLGEFLQVSGQCVLDEVVGGAAGFGGELLQAGTRFLD